MKNIRIFMLAFVFIFSAIALNAQTLKVVDSQISFDGKVRPCLSSQVDSQEDALAASWAKHMKKNYKVKLRGFGLFSNRDVFQAKDVTISELSENRMNFYTQINPTTTGSEINVFASFGYDLFIGPNSHPREYGVLDDMLYNFLLKYLDEYYRDMAKSISKNINSLNKEKLKKLKTIEKNNKSIFKLSNSIAIKNATLSKSNEEAIKVVKDVSKSSSKKIKLESENSSFEARIQAINKQVDDLKVILDNVNWKQSTLAK